MPLLERAAELAAVDDALAAAALGAGRVLLLEGAAGIGKTSLLDEARHRAAAGGLRVLVAHAGRLERDLSYGVVRQLFEAVVRSASGADRTALLAGAAELATPAVLPEVGADAEGDRRAPVVHGLFWLTANLAADRPLLLAIDDAQWSDAASLRYLDYLARRLDGLPVVVVATVRTGEAAEIAPVLAELAAAASTTVLRPAPLSTDGVEELVRAALVTQPDHGFVDACRDATGGVPFLVEALVDALSDGGITPTAAATSAVTTVTSATVGHATLLRLSWLARDALPVARHAAVLGRHATVGRIAALAGLDAATVVRACDAMTTAHILRPGAPPAFVHPIVSSSIYDEVPAGERSMLHQRVADLLAAEGESEDEVAGHLLATSPGAGAATVQTLRSAARRASGRGAPESAIAYLRRCVAEPPPRVDRAAVLHELARAEAVVRDRRAADDLAAALAGAEEPVQRARIALDLVETLMFAGRWDAALAEVGSALAELGDRDPDLAVRLEVFRAGMIANDPRLIDEFERDRSRLAGIAAGAGRAAALMAALLSSCAVCRIEPSADVRALAERGLDGDALMTGADADAWGPQAAATLAYLGRYEDALAAAEQMRIAARSRGSVYGFVRASALRALAGGLRGDLRAVEADLRSAFELSRVHELMFSAPPLLHWSVDALLERPELGDIAAAIESIGLDPALAASFSGAWLLDARGRLRAAAGDRDGAIADLTRSGETMTRLHTSNPMVTAWRSALASALPDDARAHAQALASEELTLARRTGLARPEGIALRALAEVSDDPVPLLEAAVDVLVDAPLELARTQLAIGRALRRAGRRAAADAPLRAALDLAHRCGAERTAQRAEEELRVLGARPRRRAVSGVDALTPSEARVAQQAASGMTNREIAQALFVTSKTVENQLSRVFQKLGIARRDALASALAARD